MSQYDIGVSVRERFERAYEMNATPETTATSALEDHVFKILAVSALGLVLAGTVVYRFLEDWSWVDSLYFSVIAVTTVGFGDITPSTDASKLFTILYVISGITIVTTYLRARMDRHGRKLADRRRDS
ncbi:MAG: potassium channel family protein [Actinomycetia bacterium]|nr:potassium channel family protein [Actinomycetes bacterium]